MTQEQKVIRGSAPLIGLFKSSPFHRRLVRSRGLWRGF
jgi:hypothetical protein